MNDEAERDLKVLCAVTHACREQLAGLDYNVQGGILADLVATWLAGAAPPLRESMFDIWRYTALRLVREKEQLIFGKAGHPARAEALSEDDTARAAEPVPPPEPEVQHPGRISNARCYQIAAIQAPAEPYEVMQLAAELLAHRAGERQRGEELVRRIPDDRLAYLVDRAAENAAPWEAWLIAAELLACRLGREARG